MRRFSRKRAVKRSLLPLAGTVTSVFLCDAASIEHERERKRLLDERNRLRTMMWSDPGDRELREQLERLEMELRALDGRRG